MVVVRLRLKRKYLILSLILAAIGIFAVVTGASYAYFTSNITSRDYVVYTGNLQVDYTRTGNLIDIIGAYPMTNEAGLQEPGYEFRITNNGNIDTRYQIRLEVDDNSTLPLDSVKLAYVKTKENGVTVNNPEYIEPVLLSNLNNTLTFVTNQELESGKSDEYTLKLWIDISASNQAQGKTFRASIVVDSIQNVDEGYVFGGTKPIITLNKGSDGNIDQIIEKGTDYTELGVLSVRDDKDKLSPADVTISGTVNKDVVGLYPITYSVTDSDGNTTTVNRMIAVGNSTDLNIKKSVADVISMYSQAELTANQAIFCYLINGNTDMYLGCNLHDTLDHAVASTNRGVVILTQNISTTTIHEITEEKDIQLELNGKTISVNGDYTIKNMGSLVITDSVGTGTVTNTDEKALYNLGTLVVKGGNYSADTNCALCTKGGVATIDNANITASNNAAIKNRSNGIININNATVTTTNKVAIENENGTITINDATISSTTKQAINNTAGTITINGGTFTTGSNPTIDNYSTVNINGGTFTNSSTHTINNRANANLMIGSKNPVYISTIATERSLYGIYNYGNLNINALVADQCTATSTDTTLGLCVYGSNGIKQQDSATATIIGGKFIAKVFAVDADSDIYLKNGEYVSDNYYTIYCGTDEGSTPKCYLDGGIYSNKNLNETIAGYTYNENYYVLYNESTSTFYVKNAKITGSKGINKTDANMHVCSSTLNGSNYSNYNGSCDWPTN